MRDLDGFSTVSTGFKDFDTLLGGGFSPGQVVVVSGRPGMGKSTFLYNLALNMGSNKKHVSVVSAEMNLDLLSLKMVCIHSGLEFRPVRIYGVSSKDEDAWETGSKQFYDLPLTLFSASETIKDLAAELKSHAAESQVDAIFIDGLASMQIQSQGHVYEEINRALRTLKKLAMDLGCPIILSQGVSKDTSKRIYKRPFLEDMAECDAINSIADTIIFIYRDEYYNEDTDSRNTAEIIIAKNRLGPTCYFKMFCDISIGRFADFPLEDSDA